MDNGELTAILFARIERLESEAVFVVRWLFRRDLTLHRQSRDEIIRLRALLAASLLTASARSESQFGGWHRMPREQSSEVLCIRTGSSNYAE